MSKLLNKGISKSMKKLWSECKRNGLKNLAQYKEFRNAPVNKEPMIQRQFCPHCGKELK